MTGPNSDSRSRAAAERELLARLGLTADANTQMVESAHDELVRFLETAPGDLQAWARREIAAADEAYALLFDPTAELTPAAAASIIPAAAVAPVAAKPVAKEAPRASRVQAAPADDDEIEELSDEPVPVRRPRSTTRVRAAATPVDTTVQNRLLTRLALVAAGVIGVGVLVFAVYNLGGGGGVPGFNGTPAPDASGAAASPGVDQAQVATLMQKLQANSKDTATLIDLGNVYYNGGDYATAGSFFDKALGVDPKNVEALLGRGATAYNAGDRTVAERDWRAAIVIDPKNVDAHYYLGFMYLDSASPDIAKVKAEWNQVIALAPGTSLAQTVQKHLDSLSSTAAGASGAPAGSAAPAPTSAAAPSAAPVASPAASPSASGN